MFEASVTDSKVSSGGSAANTIVGLSRLGLKTGFIGKVASDTEGKFLLEDLRKEGVNTKGVRVSESGRSGTVMGFIDIKGDRALYVDPGVNDQLDFNEINLDYVEDTKVIHLSSFVSQKPFNAQKQLINKFPNMKVCFDPGAIYARKGLNANKPIIKRSHAIFPNEMEVNQLTGEDYQEGAKTFLKLGAELVAVKLGKRGCYVTDGKENHLIEAYNVDVIDTTGAGDAFNAGFIYGLINGKDMYMCGMLGNFVASRCVSMMGARKGLPKLVDLEDH
ncbi:MAG: carbohydrate kinase family protein [Candidatus Bathyarchaeota archaeon]